MTWRHVLALTLAAIALAAVAVWLPWTRTFLVIAMSKGLAALGITILLRAGQVSFGHAMFFAASAYAAGYTSRWLGGTDIAVMLIAGVFVASILSIAVGLFLVRYRQIFFGMLNLAFSMVLYSVLEKFFQLTGGSDGLRMARPSIFGLALDRNGFDLALVILSIGLALLANIGTLIYFDSPLGQALRAIKTNETRLEYIGASARRVLLVGYIFSAITGAIGGVLLAALQGLASPSFAYWIQSGEFVFISILGGASYPIGAFVGALVFEGVKIYASAFATDVWELILGVVIIAIILFAPRGGVGLIADLFTRKDKSVEPSLDDAPVASETQR
ncbi:MAG: branched-chain amino acid ABC transporter permease [Pseudomonadota bacterium]